MRFGEYLEGKAGVILVHFAAVWALFLFLLAVGLGPGETGLILIIWAVILAGWLGITFYRERKYFEELFGTLEYLEKPYLVTQVMKEPASAEGKLFWRAMGTALKAMTEEMAKGEERQREYQEYVEQWVHEVKLPLAAAQLICENEKTKTTRRIMGNLEQLDNGIEQVLYMARMEKPEQDYRICPVKLEECVFFVVTGFRESFMRLGVCIETEGLEQVVNTDRKWLEFMLRQVMSNSLKYMGENPCIRLTASKEKEAVQLFVEDNGCGIRQSDLGRIFEKGFTGSNGRDKRESTGMGLYICRELCQKLGLGIRAESKPGTYTRVTFTIPSSSEEWS